MPRNRRPTTPRSADPPILQLHVQPRAKRTEVAGWHGDAIKIRVAAPPADGAANEALLQFLAKRLGVGRGALSLTAGATSRRKRVSVTGLDLPAVLERLGIAEKSCGTP